MKLLHLTNHYPPFGHGVVEKQCRLIVNELALRGHVSRVLTSNLEAPGIHDREAFVRRKLRLSGTGAPTAFFQLLFDEWRNANALADELDQLSPDVVIVWSMVGLSNSLLWEIERRRIPTVFAVLDPWPRHRVRDDLWYHWWTSPLAFDQRFIRRTLRELRLDRPIMRRFPVRRPSELAIKRAFFASRTLRDTIRSANYTIGESEIIPHCLGRDEIPAHQQHRDDSRRILWIGALDTDRDPMTAVQAIQELRHQGEMRFSLDLFGHGDPTMEARVRDYVRNAQLGGAVTVRNASVEEMVAVFPTYDIFLKTERYPDSFPVVMIRAMAARLPVISTTEGSCGDVVRNGENALSFRTGDPIDCANKILQLSADRELVVRLTETAYREVLDNYSALIVAGRIERILVEAAKHRADGA